MNGPGQPTRLQANYNTTRQVLDVPDLHRTNGGLLMLAATLSKARTNVTTSYFKYYLSPMGGE